MKFRQLLPIWCPHILLQWFRLWKLAVEDQHQRSQVGFGKYLQMKICFANIFLWISCNHIINNPINNHFKLSNLTILTPFYGIRTTTSCWIRSWISWIFYVGAVLWKNEKFSLIYNKSFSLSYNLIDFKIFTEKYLPLRLYRRISELCKDKTNSNIINNLYEDIINFDFVITNIDVISYLIKQQTPKPAAQFPRACPTSSHSLEVMQTPVNFVVVVHWLILMKNSNVNFNDLTNFCIVVKIFYEIIKLMLSKLTHF